MKRAFLAMSLLASLAASAAGFETVRDLTLPAEGLKKLEITAGAGSLTVKGREGLSAVEVRAEIVFSGVSDKDMEEYLKDDVELSLTKVGNAAVLVGRIRDRGLLHIGRDARVDLSVSVPKALALEIDDGSGPLEVEDIAAGVRIEDGSGSLRVTRVAGRLWINDGSGEITVDGVEGDVEITDGSGGLEILNVTGDVSVEDGSGEMTLRHIGGEVTIDDGSGDIDIADVGKDIRLIDTGSGGVSISGEKGRVIR